MKLRQNKVPKAADCLATQDRTLGSITGTLNSEGLVKPLFEGLPRLASGWRRRGWAGSGLICFYLVSVS